jgi:hypothetical protein
MASTVPLRGTSPLNHRPGFPQPVSVQPCREVSQGPATGRSLRSYQGCRKQRRQWQGTPRRPWGRAQCSQWLLSCTALCTETIMTLWWCNLSPGPPPTTSVLQTVIVASAVICGIQFLTQVETKFPCLLLCFSSSLAYAFSLSDF